MIDVDAVRTLLAGRAGPAMVPAPCTRWTRPERGDRDQLGRAGRFDAVLLAAGAGTAPLAAQVGV